MRLIFTLLFSITLGYLGWSQPPNDNCSNAEFLNLSTAPNCPSTAPVTDFFTSSNVGATAVSPYPIFGTCPSGSTTGPAAEVWFTFIGTANQTTITATGLSNPNIVLYTGTNCISMQAINCTSGSGSATMVTNTLIGETYFLLVSGGDVNDQGTINLEIQSNNLCNSCAPPGAISLSTSPPPINGTYTSGQQVQVCVRVNEWNGNAAGTIEWLHACTFQFGSGWDISSLNPLPVDNCSTGSWGWYDSWVGCNTGQTFGPGFAFESNSGVNNGCPAGPGNNWGDGGGGCSTIPNGNYPFFEFCVDINVSDCPPAFTGGDLGIVIDIYSDGDSGSWTQTGCNSGQTYSTSASIVCCNDLPPVVTPVDPSCYLLDDGSVEVWGNGAMDPTEVFNYFIFDASNNLVWECIDCVGSVVTPSFLAAGNYTVTAINVATDCPRSEVITLTEPAPPQTTAIQTNEPCPGDNAFLEGSVDVSGSNIAYTWTGPSGQTLNGQSVSVQEAGPWEVTAIVDGCPALPGTVDVTFVDFMTDIVPSATEVCAGETFNLMATNGMSFTWTNQSTGENLGSGQSIDIALSNSATIVLEADNGQGCTATATQQILVNQLPIISVDVSGNPCDNSTLILTAVGAGGGGSYVWQDNFSTQNPRELINPPAGFYSFTVEGTDANGCVGTGEVFFDVFASPQDAQLVADNFSVCAGQPVTITAEAGDLTSIFWYDGVAPPNQNPITVNPTSDVGIAADVTNSFGCTVTVSTDITIEAPPLPINVYCGNVTPNSIEIFWDAQPDAEFYEVTAGGNPMEVTSNLAFTLNGLSPGEDVSFTVLPVGADLCPMMPTTITCSTQDCAPVTLAIDPVADICLTTGGPAAFDLTFTADTPGGAIAWSGPGITDSDDGTFSPTVAGVGNHTVELDYTIGDCTYTATVDIAVFNTPTANFSLSADELCIGQSLDVTYEGTGGPGATYNWDFGIDAFADPGNGAGPHEVNWSTTGTKTISLTVTENGCTSQVFTETVEVDQELEGPIISCGNATTSSVTFNWNNVTGALGYTVSVLTGQSGTQSGNTYSVNGLMPGEMVTIEVTGITDGICGALATQFTCSAQPCPNFTIDIAPVSPICLTAGVGNTTLSANVTGGSGSGNLSWSGTGVTGNTFNPSTAGEGTHTITATYQEGPCQETATIDILVFDLPTSDFAVMPDTVCTGETITVTYTGDADVNNATFNWNFGSGMASSTTGPGPITVSWTNPGTKNISLSVQENGCTSTPTTDQVTVVGPLAAPVINCQSTTSSIVFSWAAVPGATSYDVAVTSGPTGTLDLNALTYTVTGLTSGDGVTIEVTALGDGPCPDPTTTATCVAEDCPTDVVLAIDPVAPICLDTLTESTTLTANISGGAGGGTATWSGAGITDATNGVFDPQVSGAGAFNITLTYQEGNCTYNNSIQVQVFDVPTSGFMADAIVCQGDTTTVSYTGSAGAGAAYAWTFTGGTVVADNGQTQTVAWPNAGDQTISLVVTEDGCTSDTTMQTVTVQEPLPAPVISCAPTTSSVTFSWDPIPGATNYNVNVISGPTGSLDLNNLTYTVNGLTAGDVVDIEVIALGPAPCGNSSAAASCTAENCPAVTIAIDPVAPICLATGIGTTTLSAAVTGGNGTGALTWSGTAIVDVQNGVFNPQTAGVGTHTVTATYEEANCSFSETIDIEIFAIPTATFTTDAVVCQGDTSILTYTGSAGTGATFDWTYADGTLLTDEDTMQVVSWPTAGDQTVTLVVTENGCSSQPAMQTVTVDAPLAAPVIDCQATTNSVTFSWDPVPGATDYTVNLISGPAGTVDLNALTYTVTGLNSGDMVDIEVVAIGPAPCGNSSATASCTASDCPNVMLAITSVPDLCLDPALAPLTLEVEVIGGNGGGAISWSGDGITDALNGTFAPAMLDTGATVITVTYTEANCSWTESTTINILPTPTADFTADTQVCVNAEALLTFTGMASDSAAFNWDFAGGTATPGTGAGPHTVTWASPGDQTVTLTVTDNGCESEPFSTTVVVLDSLATPVISCDSDNTSITFSWAPVAGATDYTVDLLSGTAGVLDANNLTYTVTGLNPGDEVSLQVNVLTDHLCGGVSAAATCSAQVCPALAFADTTYGPFCEDAGIQTLEPALADGNGMGAFTWSGPGIVTPAGEFDPALAGVGTFDLALTYSNSGCIYDTTYAVTVLPVPVASFTADGPICQSDNSTITFDGAAGPTATFDWDFDGGMASGSDGGPYTVTWPAAGVYTVSLTVTEAGCVSETFTEEITVDPVIEPVTIVCAETTNTSITFAWDPVPGADTYTVAVIQGPSGTQSGNTYTVDGLSPDDVVTIEVTAGGNTICGSSVATGECIAQACQPLTLALDGPTEVCAGEDASLVFDLTTGQAGPFIVTYTVGGGPEQQITVTDGDALTLTALDANTQVNIVEVTSAALADCTYPQNLSWSISVEAPANAGTALDGPSLCPEDAQVIDLGTLLVDADADGLWAETGGPGSTGGNFDDNGQFNTANQAAGVYEFTYTVAGNLCPDATASVEVEVFAEPTVNAGTDQELTCAMGMVSLGNGATASGPGVSYVWTVSNPNVNIADPNELFIDVSAPATYFLEVTDANGCTNTDQVVVTASQDAPVAEVTVSEITCFGTGDGAISIGAITGGQPPYAITFNDEPASTETFFSGLGGGIYDIVITDQNGCFTELSTELMEPTPVEVTLGTNLENDSTLIKLGESIRLQARFAENIPLDTIRWTPDSIASGLVTEVTVSPMETSQYSVTIIDENGCSATDVITILVDKQRNVFFPTAFSPDGDGINDIFYPFAGDDVVEVKSFLLFNRWGETVFENYDFNPNVPGSGWDGTYRQKEANAAVYVYFAEVEFTDGEVILFKGDVVLMR